jgi:hypothetical protein
VSAPLRLFPRLVLVGTVLILAAGAPLRRVSDAKIPPALQGSISRAAADAGSGDSTLSVWVYFADKGERSPRGLAAALQVAQRTLRARCVWRRSKVRSAANLVDPEDLEIAPEYASTVKSLASRVRTVSRWLNAMSVEATPDEIRALSALDFVSGLDLVRGFRRNKDDAALGEEPGAGAPAPPVSGSSPEAAAVATSPVYGSAYPQLEQIGVPALRRTRSSATPA